MDIAFGPARPRDLCQELEQTFRPIAESKGLDLEVELDPGLPAAITTDHKRLEQIVKNLLANGIKFTERGEVRLEVRVVIAGRLTPLPPAGPPARADHARSTRHCGSATAESRRSDN